MLLIFLFIEKGLLKKYIVIKLIFLVSKFLISYSLVMEMLNQFIISRQLSSISENETILARQKLEKRTNMLNALQKVQLNS